MAVYIEYEADWDFTVVDSLADYETVFDVDKYGEPSYWCVRFCQTQDEATIFLACEMSHITDSLGDASIWEVDEIKGTARVVLPDIDDMAMYDVAQFVGQYVIYRK